MAIAQRASRGIIQGTARTVSFFEHLLIVVAAFAVVIWFNLFVNPEIGKNNRYFLLNGDFVSLAIVLIETLVLGAILRYLVTLTFKAQFRRARK